MLDFNQFQQIKQVKDSSPFTCSKSLSTYIDDVKGRISKWYGIPKEEITAEDVYCHLMKGRK